MNKEYISRMVLTGFFLLSTCVAWWGFIFLVIKNDSLGAIGMLVLIAGSSVMTIISSGERDD